ncbi:MAG: hypothetical protein R3F43_00460 [bacterium]
MARPRAARRSRRHRRWWSRRSREEPLADPRPTDSSRLRPPADAPASAAFFEEERKASARQAAQAAAVTRRAQERAQALDEDVPRAFEDANTKAKPKRDGKFAYEAKEANGVELEVSEDEEVALRQPVGNAEQAAPEEATVELARGEYRVKTVAEKIPAPEKPAEAPPPAQGLVLAPEVPLGGDLQDLKRGDLASDDGDDDGEVDGRFKNDEGAGRDRLAGKKPESRRPAVDGGLLDDGWFARTEGEGRPSSFLPRMFYFENTYQGRSAAFLERLRRLDAEFGGRERPYLLSSLPPQPVDPPEDKGLALSVALDRQWIDQPGRVYLQVALQGSRRYGWRRPPLDVVVVVDAAAAARRPADVLASFQRLLTSLGPQDRLGAVLAGDPPVVLAELGDLRDTRQALNRLEGRVRVAGEGLAPAMGVAGRLLQAASQGQARVPGSQTVLVLADGVTADLGAAAGVAHALTVQGATTSVFDLGGGYDWWPVANAGHGNLHAVEGDVAAAIDDELARISQVIARLLRVNIRLAPNVQAVRVLGSRVLEADEVKAVKAREEATDRQLSATLGVKADRGDDDDGVQTVIPFFYGGDTHVILVELWVEKPGPVAEVSLRYKDMVALDNATAHAGARLGGVPRPGTAADVAVRRNVRGFLLAEALDEAGRLIARGEVARAQARLETASADDGADQRMLQAFRRSLGSLEGDLARDALEYASRRRISHVAQR